MTFISPCNKEEILQCHACDVLHIHSSPTVGCGYSIRQFIWRPEYHSYFSKQFQTLDSIIIKNFLALEEIHLVAQGGYTLEKLLGENDAE